MRSFILVAVFATLLGAAGAAQAAAAALRFESPWLRATPAGASVGAGYASLNNDGDAPRVIVRIESAVAAQVQIHSMSHQHGMMQMREKPSLAVPAHGSAVLQPGADHLMLLGLKQPLLAGQTVSLEFVFDDGGRQRVDFVVRDAAP